MANYAQLLNVKILYRFMNREACQSGLNADKHSAGSKRNPGTTLVSVFKFA
jgi:hypothetical protein